MVMIAFLAGTGSPGVTTAAFALAATWSQQRPVILAELDVTGGDVIYWVQAWDGSSLSLDRGLISLAASVHSRTDDPAEVWDHVQDLDNRVSLLAGSSGPEQSMALASGLPAIAEVMAGVADADVLVDCGRVISSGTPLAPVIQQADLVVLVARAEPAAAARLTADLQRVIQVMNAGENPVPASKRACVLLVDARPTTRWWHLGSSRQPREVAEVLAEVPVLEGLPVVDVIARDALGARTLNGQTRWPWWRRSPLERTARRAGGKILKLAGGTGLEPRGPHQDAEPAEESTASGGVYSLAGLTPPAPAAAKEDS